MGLLDRVRRVYYFGYGAERDPAVLQAIIGAKPKVIGAVTVNDHELRVQDLEYIKPLKAKKLLNETWGGVFKTYTLVPKKGKKVAGTLYQLSLARRHDVDLWELIDMGWYVKRFIQAELASGGVLEAETQILANTRGTQVVDGLNYETWLMPKSEFINKATALRAQDVRRKSPFNKAVYYFGYGAQQSPNMVQAVIGTRPKVIGSATLKGYELRTQDISEMSNADAQRALVYAWGKDFKCYTIVPNPNAEVNGVVYRMSLHRRHMLDKWSLVPEGWHQRRPVTVVLASGKKVRAGTQVLSPKESITQAVGAKRDSWVVPKRELIAKAKSLRPLLK